MPNVLIRQATDADWPRIWPIWHRIVAAGETYTWDPDTSEQDARALWTGPGKRVFVAEDDTGAVLGTACLKPNYGGPAARIANAGFMVDPGRRGRGVGRALAEHVLDAARADGYRAMVFNAVVETNPAVALWTSLGFRILGTVPRAFDHPRHGPVGLHIMYKELVQAMPRRGGRGGAGAVAASGQGQRTRHHGRRGGEGQPGRRDRGPYRVPGAAVGDDGADEQSHQPDGRRDAERAPQQTRQQAHHGGGFQGADGAEGVLRAAETACGGQRPWGAQEFGRAGDGEERRQADGQAGEGVVHGNRLLHEATRITARGGGRAAVYGEDGPDGADAAVRGEGRAGVGDLADSRGPAVRTPAARAQDGRRGPVPPGDIGDRSAPPGRLRFRRCARKTGRASRAATGREVVLQKS